MSMFQNANDFTVNDSQLIGVTGNYTINNYGNDSVSPLFRFHQLLSGVDCEAIHQNVRSIVQAQPKAGTWLVNNKLYTAWKEGQSQTRLLWLKGIPGAGKTVISSRVIDDIREIQDPQIAVLIFYCERTDPTKCDPTTLLASLLDQLLRIVPSETLAVTNMIKRYQDVQSINKLPLTNLIVDLSRGLEKTFVIIDALDECDDLANLLPQIRKLARRVSVFVTSRDHPDIRDEFREGDVISMGPDDIAGDVRDFVEAEMKLVSIQNPQLREAVLEKLISDAHGTFLWPVCHLQQLRKLRTDREIRQSLQNIPQRISEFILNALEAVAAQPLSEQLRSVLQLVVCAERPITLRALAQAIATTDMGKSWDPSRVDSHPNSLVDDCAHLLTRIPAAQRGRYDFYWTKNCSKNDNEDGILPDDDIVVSFHASVKTFLREKPETIPPSLEKYIFYPISATHDELANLCLKHLNLILRFTKSRDMEPSDYPFAMYSLREWHAHVRGSGKPPASFDEELNPLHTATTSSASSSVVVHEVIQRLRNDLGLLVKLFLDHDTNINARDNQGRTPLHLAAESGHAARVALLLGKGADIDVIDDGGWTPLLAACTVLYSSGRKEYELVIEHLLNHGANINARDQKGYTALHWAINDRLLLQQLLSRGANIDARDNENRAALHWAAQSGHTSCVKILLEQGAMVDAVSYAGDTPLLAACIGFYRSNDQKRLKEYQLIVDHLVNYGANINARGKKGYSTLHWAINDESMFKHLLDHDANINQGDDEGCTPLHWAAHSGHVSCVALLLERGAMVDALNKAGETPLLTTCNGLYHSDDKRRSAEYQPILDQLIDYGANVNAQDHKGYTTLHWAINNEILMKHLLDRGTSINACDIGGSTALHWSAQSGHISCVNLLVEKRARVDTVNNSGETPLLAACNGQYHSGGQSRYEEYQLILECLLKYGADINARDQKGYTVLHWAINDAVIMKQLLDHGANVNARDGSGGTPLHWVAHSGHTSCVALLLEKGALVDVFDNAGATPLSYALHKAGEASVEKRESYDLIIAMLRGQL